MKELPAISWNVTEPEYRQDPALSYSAIAKYERGGFDSIPTLFDPISSPSLTFGSVVDELITGTKETFDARFIIAEFPKLKPAAETAVKALHAEYGETCKFLEAIPDAMMITTLDMCEYNKHWKAETRIKSLREAQECCDYYRLLSVSDKEIINQTVYDDAAACAHALKTGPFTRKYFKEDTEGSGICRYYQLKFKAELDGVMYRCMADLLIVDYEHKVILPCDLKTSSSKEYEFGHSFQKWRYDIQARLYWRVIRKCLDADPYFKVFLLKDFQFIVVNKDTKRPLVWWFSKTKDEGDIMLGDMLLRDPCVIGKELQGYLENKPTVPDGINECGLNDICAWIDKHKQ